MTVGRALDTSRRLMVQAGIDSADLDSLILAELAFGRDRAYLLAHQEKEISDIQQTEFEAMVTERCSRKPIAHITQEKEFHGLKFKVTCDVLAPRPESEKIVEYAIKYTPKDSRLIDVGTGCGALAIAIAKHRPDLEITATEISPAAIEVARTNINHHKTPITLLQSDLFTSLHFPNLKRVEPFPGWENTFSAVVANLPYLKDDAELTPEASREPEVALRGGKDGLDIYRRFFDQLPAHLEKPGFVFIESDPWQQPELIKIARRSAGFKPIEQDYFVLGFTTELR